MSPTGFETLYTINCKNVPDQLGGPLRFFPWVVGGGGGGQGHEVYHSLPRSTEEKNAWSYTFATLYAFMARMMIISYMRR